MINSIYFVLWLGSLIFLIVRRSDMSHHQGITGDVVFINTTASIARTDDHYVCATLDYHTHSWDISASVLNLDLNNRILVNAVKAFSPLKLRVGGTLQDRLVYETTNGSKLQNCHPFVKDKDQPFGFKEGCLNMSRWDQLNRFFNDTGAEVVFGLNELDGKTIEADGMAVGNWDSSNAQALMQYTLQKGYSIHGWELGNELSGRGIGTSVAANQYATDADALYNLVQQIYSNETKLPLVMAPGGMFDPLWFTQFISKTTNSVQVISHHIYNLGPGAADDVVETILDPSYLDGGAYVYRELQSLLRRSGTSAVAWVSEAGGAYQGGHNLVTNAFVMSFWYLDQLGMAATYDTKTYCRQTLIGEFYGLLNTTSFVPNPDYYSALLWHRLMGKYVLSTRSTGTNKLRAYAHCSKQSQGITMVLLNLDNKNEYQVQVSTENGLIIAGGLNIKRNPRTRGRSTREEYHLTCPNGNLHSQTLLLNGKVLSVNSSGDIPPLVPSIVSMLEPVTVAPVSIVFVHFSGVISPVCNQN